MFTRVEKGVLVKFARWTGFGFGSSLDQRAESKHEAEEAVGRRWIYTSSPLAVAFLFRLSTSFYIPFTYPRLLVYQSGRIDTVGHGIRLTCTFNVPRDGCHVHELGARVWALGWEAVR